VATDIESYSLLLLIGINAQWGVNFIAGKEGTQTFGPLLFITIRFAVVLFLLCVFLRWVPGQMARIAAIGLCMGVGHYAFMFYGVLSQHQSLTLVVLHR